MVVRKVDPAAIHVVDSVAWASTMVENERLRSENEHLRTLTAQPGPQTGPTGPPGPSGAQGVQGPVGHSVVDINTTRLASAMEHIAGALDRIEKVMHEQVPKPKRSAWDPPEEGTLM